MLYIEAYWSSAIGGTDDCLTLLEYLAQKGKTELPLGEIFADIGLDHLHGDFRRPELPLAYMNPEGWEMGFCCAMDLVMELAALVLECTVNERVDLHDLLWEPEESDESHFPPGLKIRITATAEETALLCRTLQDFVDTPSMYDFSDMLMESELAEVAAACEILRKELQNTACNSCSDSV